MLTLPLRMRAKVALELPVDQWLEDLRGQRVGQVVTRYGSTEWEVLDLDGRPLAYLCDATPNALNSVTISLHDAQRAPLGRLHCPQMIAGMLGRLHGEVYAEGHTAPRYALREDSVALRLIYQALEYVPWLALAANYLLRPRYTLRTPRGRKVATLTKEGSLLGADCRMEPFGSVSRSVPQADQLLITLALLALAQIEFRWKSL